MQYVVFMKFLHESAISPEELCSHINAQWIWIEDAVRKEPEEVASIDRANPRKPESAICIINVDSMEQLFADMAAMPGGGILQVEVFPVSEEVEHQPVSSSLYSQNN